MECEHRHITAIESLGVPVSHVCGDCGATMAPPQMEAHQLPRCGTCRWAEAHDLNAVSDEEYVMEHPDDLGGLDELRELQKAYPLRCSRMGGNDDLTPMVKASLAFSIIAENDVTDFSQVLVSPEFGCVMWEAKP